MDKTVLHLQIARSLRSVSQGIAVVDLALYLKAVGWSGAAIGGVLSAASLVGAVLILMVGVMSDRLGRKPFLLVYELLSGVAALAMTFTANPAVVTLVIVTMGFGRGQNGAAGPFTPAEQAWMASRVTRDLRGRVFSTNTALGFFGMAIGAVVGGTPHLWQGWLPGALAYRPLFFLMFVFSVACAIVIALAPRESPAVEVAPVREVERAIRREENTNLFKLVAVNSLNGLAIGFFGPMMSYWFAVKFGASASEVGIALALSFLVTGGSSLVAGRMTQRFGMVRSVVWLQLCGIVMMLLLPLMPTFWLASTLYIVRSAFSRGTQGARSALSSSLTRDHRRGFSVSLNALGMRLPSTVGPTLSGYMLDSGEFSAPFFIAAGLQLTSTLLYGRLFRSFDLPDDHASPAPPTGTVERGNGQ